MRDPRGAQDVERVDESGGSRGQLPNFLIVGAPRCGTTSLSSYLSGHPDVFIAPQKEVHYFDHYHRRGDDWYRAQFTGSRSRRLVGEASPSYMFEEEAMERMARLVPDAKLVAILREPVARMYSAYWFRKELAGEEQTFEQAIEEEQRPDFTPRKRLPLLLTHSTYLPALERVCRYYPRSSLQVHLLDDLRVAPEETFGSLCGFLGIDASVKPPKLGKAVNRTHRLRSRRLYRSMVRMRAWRRLPFRLGYALDEWNRVPFTYPDMDPATKDRLHAMFAERNAALAAWLGRDLSIWDN
jgi:sulfotransferase family protein